ncbi:MAG TPA: cytochrome c [Thauera aminoaromatica]|nr:cytochrome c [Thauera aminoaromatica]
MQSNKIRILVASLALSCAHIALAADPPAEGRDRTYAKVCSFCHDKGVGPAILGRALPAAYIENVVRHGFRAMPSFRSSEIDNAALASVARWVSQSPDSKASTASPAPSAAPATKAQ